MSDPAEAESNAEWARVLDRLIDWAVAQADAAVEEICSYLRASERRQSHDLLPDWARSYARSSLPYRGRGRDRDCSSLRRRLRSHQDGRPRPLGAARPPRARRTPG